METTSDTQRLLDVLDARLAPLELHTSTASAALFALRHNASAITRHLCALDERADQLIGLLTARLEHFERISTLAFERCARLEAQLDRTHARPAHVDGVAPPSRP
jgi:hypothetical protein